MKSWLKAIIKNQNMKKTMANLLGIVKQQQAPSTFEVFLPLIWPMLQKVLILQILIWTGAQLKRIALHTQNLKKKCGCFFIYYSLWQQQIDLAWRQKNTNKLTWLIKFLSDQNLLKLFKTLKDMEKTEQFTTVALLKTETEQIE